MSGARHHDLICRGDCELSDSSFNLRLAVATESLIEKAQTEVNHRLGVELVRIESSHYYGFTNDQLSYALLPYELGLDISLNLRFSKTGSINLLQELIDVQRKAFQLKTATLEDLHIHLVCALFSNDSSSLERAFRNSSLSLPACLMSWLLEKAMVRKSIDCLRVLLENGASPVACLSLRDEFRSPIRFCMYMMTYLRNQEDEPELVTILKLLIQFGLKFDPSSMFDRPDLEYVDTLPLYSMEATIALIDGCARASTATFDQLNRCLQFSIDNRLREDPAEHVRVIAFGLVPMLRAGARFNFSSSSQMIFEGFVQRRWNPTPILVEVILEARGNSSSINQDLIDTFPPFRTCFPRKLQAITRQVVVKQLSVGVEQREAKIDRLELPECLRQYLKFSEFHFFI